MKRKSSLAFAFALALALVFAFSASAQAANVYDINASFSPTKTGTKKKPRPVGGTFGFTVTDTNGQRPAALDALEVTFTGMRLNTRFFRGCSATSMEQAQSDAGCPSAALVASGFAKNIAGDQSNRADTSQRCNLSVNLWNSGNGKMALFVSGNPNATDENERCPLPIATAIPVSITRRSSGDVLEFSIPDNLKNPIGTIRNALVDTQLEIRRKTTRRKGKRRGFLETFGGCRNGNRQIIVDFDNEGNDDDRTQSEPAKCKK